MTTDVSSSIAGILAEVLDVDVEAISPENSLVADLHVDSLAMIEVVISVEKTFGVVIAEDDVRHLVTVAELTSYVESRTALASRAETS